MVRRLGTPNRVQTRTGYSNARAAGVDRFAPTYLIPHRPHTLTSHRHVQVSKKNKGYPCVHPDCVENQCRFCTKKCWKAGWTAEKGLNPVHLPNRSDPVCTFLQSINPHKTPHTARADAGEREELKYKIDVMDCGGKAWCSEYRRAGPTADFTTITHLDSRRIASHRNTRPHSLRHVCHDGGSQEIVTKKGCPTRQCPRRWRTAGGGRFLDGHGWQVNPTRIGSTLSVHSRQQ